MLPLLHCAETLELPELPEDTIHHLHGYLNDSEFKALSKVNKNFNRASQRDKQLKNGYRASSDLGVNLNNGKFKLFDEIIPHSDDIESFNNLSFILKTQKTEFLDLILQQLLPDPQLHEFNFKFDTFLRNYKSSIIVQLLESQSKLSYLSNNEIVANYLMELFLWHKFVKKSFKKTRKKVQTYIRKHTFQKYNSQFKNILSCAFHSLLGRDFQNGDRSAFFSEPHEQVYLNINHDIGIEDTYLKISLISEILNIEVFDKISTKFYKELKKSSEFKVFIKKIDNKLTSLFVDADLQEDEILERARIAASFVFSSLQMSSFSFKKDPDYLRARNSIKNILDTIADPESVVSILANITPPLSKPGDQVCGPLVENQFKIASAGSIEAQYNIGNIYNFGVDVDRNISRAIEFYKLAAQQGHAAAKESLVGLLQSGNF